MPLLESSRSSVSLGDRARPEAFAAHHVEPRWAYGETSPKLARIMRERRQAAFADGGENFVRTETRTWTE
jgi:hypothetical protein